MHLGLPIDFFGEGGGVDAFFLGARVVALGPAVIVFKEFEEDIAFLEVKLIWHTRLVGMNTLVLVPGDGDAETVGYLGLEVVGGEHAKLIAGVAFAADSQEGEKRENDHGECDADG